MLSVYHDVGSPVHALPAWVKLLALVGAGVGVFVVVDARVLGGAVVVTAALFALARIPWRVALRQLRPVLPVLVLVAAAQVLIAGWYPALLVTERLVLLLALAALVTLSTRTEDLVDVVEVALRPLVPLGVRPDRVGMVVLMTIRFVPVVAEQAAAVRAAQRARGVERSTVFLTPLLVKTLRMADSLAQALDARGVDSGPARRPGSGVARGD